MNNCFTIESNFLNTLGQYSHSLEFCGKVLISSCNIETIREVKSLFEGISLKDFKEGVLDDTERHIIMRDLMFKGNSLISKEYFNAKETRDKLIKDYKDSLDYNTSGYLFEELKAPSKVSAEVYRITGWRFN